MVAWCGCRYQRSGISDQDARSRRAPQNVAATNAGGMQTAISVEVKRRRKGAPTERSGHRAEGEFREF
jgi:hypothetical protein